MHQFRLIALGLLLGALLPRLGSAEPFTCSVCHKSLVRGAVMHKPVQEGGCLSCHKQLSDNHPLGQGSMGFIVPKERLCAECHGSLLVKPKLHGPVAKGECLACHLPHSSDNASLLKDPVPALCFRCHDKKLFAGVRGHAPVDKGNCLGCHDAHQSDVGALLRKPGSQLCFSCHSVKYGTGNSLHRPIASGSCIDCHGPHGSAYRKILKGQFPDALYLPFKKEAYGLCFSCHNPALVTEARTTSATNFRNGSRNLHSVHVNKADRGRSCKICHSPHSSTQDRLILTKSPSFGAWEIPIIFKTTPTGGGCSVGCHKTFRYDREKAVVQ